MARFTREGTQVSISSLVSQKKKLVYLHLSTVTPLNKANRRNSSDIKRGYSRKSITEYDEKTVWSGKWIILNFLAQLEQTAQHHCTAQSVCCLPATYSLEGQNNTIFISSVSLNLDHRCHVPCCHHSHGYTSLEGTRCVNFFNSQSLVQYFYKDGWQSWCLISLLGCFSRLHIGPVYPNICRWWSVFSGNLIISLYITQRGLSIVTSSKNDLFHTTSWTSGQFSSTSHGEDW
jgi:hypothetical protein